MAHQWGMRSLRELETVCHELRVLAHAVLVDIDCSVIEGHRGEAEQNRYLAEGKTQLSWPHSLHNADPSRAIHLMPYPIDWGSSGTAAQRSKAISRLYYFGGWVVKTGKILGYRIRWGGDWDEDHDPRDQSFDDLVHFEFRGYLDR